MPRQLALILCIGLIVWLIRCDRSRRRLESNALWIPAIWIAILASRPPSLWLSLFGIESEGHREGSHPLDTSFYFLTIAAAFVVLKRKDFTWGAFFRANGWLILLYLYLATSALWADDGLGVVRRLLKDFGHVVVALVLLWRANPTQAIRIVFARVGYVLIPLSIVFAKFFTFGRIATRAGDVMYTGVTMHKNSMGMLALVMGLVYLAELYDCHRRGAWRSDRRTYLITAGMFVLCVMQISLAGSVTALVCFLLGTVVYLGALKVTSLSNPQAALVPVVVMVLLAIAVDSVFDFSTKVAEYLDRDLRTMTGRTEIWAMAKDAHDAPVLGTGFYSFWRTEAAREISQSYEGTLNTVHNGYREMYLDGGFAGVALLGLLLLAWVRKSLGRVTEERSVPACFAFMILVVALTYNTSETAFFRISLMWFVLILLMIERPSFNK